jgi:uncharacterized membrane protein YeaQ/YmgE (transglycosylase-associated protein family)
LHPKLSVFHQPKRVHTVEGLIGLIIQLVSGAVGGNIAGALLKNLSLGTVGNSIAGILGGGIGGQLLGTLGVKGAAATGGLDLAGIVSSIAGGGVGGGVLMAIIGLLRGSSPNSARSGPDRITDALSATRQGELIALGRGARRCLRRRCSFGDRSARCDDK